MGEHWRGFKPGGMAENVYSDSGGWRFAAPHHVTDVQVSIPMLYATASCVEAEYLNIYDPVGLPGELSVWEGDPSLLMALQQQLPPHDSSLTAVSAPTMHPNLVSTLKSLIDVDMISDAATKSSNGKNRTQMPGVDGGNCRPGDSRRGGNEDDIAIVPVDLIRNRRPFRCAHAGCNKTFKNPQTLKMHHKTHCPVDPGGCRVEYPQNGGGGVRAGHNKKIPSRCPVCRRTFVGLYELRRHFGRKHSEGEKMHGCRKCGKRFYIEVDLRDHEKLCGEPIECRCGMKFAFKCNLVAHKKTHPECQESSSCLDDSKSSSSNSSLLQKAIPNIPSQNNNSNKNNLAAAAVMPSVEGGFPEMLPAAVKLEDIEFSCVNRGVPT